MTAIKKLIPVFFRLLSSVTPGMAARLARRLFSQPLRPANRPDDLTLARNRAILDQSKQRQLITGSGEVQLYHWPAKAIDAPRVLVVHGWTSSTDHMLHFIQALHRAGCDVHALDFPAHGRSPGDILTQPMAVEVIREVCWDIGPVTTLLGHSFGGAMSLMSLQEPDGTASPIAPQQIITVAAPARLEHVLDRFADMIGLGQRATVKLKQQIENTFSTPLWRMTPEHVSSLWEGELTVIHDASDREIPLADARIAAAAFPAAQLHITEGLGHRRILRDDAVAELIVSAIVDTAPTPDLKQAA